MKNLVLFAATALLSFSALAENQPRIVKKSRETGKEMSIELTASECSQPPIFPQTNSFLKTATVQSYFQYVTCREVVIEEFEQTGSGWSVKSVRTNTPAETQYILKRIQGGDSQTIFPQGNQDYIDFLQYSQSYSSVIKVCQAERKAATATTYKLENTPCAGQILK